MQGFSSKLTTYDFLGILIPGIVIVAVIIHLFYPDCLYEPLNSCCYAESEITWKNSSFIADILHAIILFSISYIIGLLVNCLSDCFFGKFRNNDLHLHISRKIFHRSISRRTKEKPLNRRKKIKEYFDIIRQIFGRKTVCYTPLQNEYYNEYYWLTIYKRLSGSVLILESQVAFAKNMILPTLLAVGYAVIAEHYVFGISLLILFLCELYIMCARQMRLYVIIFEDYYWTKKITNDEKYINDNLISHHSCIHPGSELQSGEDGADQFPGANV